MSVSDIFPEVPDPDDTLNMARRRAAYARVLERQRAEECVCGARGCFTAPSHQGTDQPPAVPRRSREPLEPEP